VRIADAGTSTQVETRNGKRQKRRRSSRKLIQIGHFVRPHVATLTDINGKLLESVANAQKDWAEFVHRRVKEDIAVSQQLMGCRSLGDVQQTCSQYMCTAFERYREQSQRAVQRSNSTTAGLAQALKFGAKDSTGVRH
jgi:Phasin protein